MSAMNCLTDGRWASLGQVRTKARLGYKNILSRIPFLLRDITRFARLIFSRNVKRDSTQTRLRHAETARSLLISKRSVNTRANGRE